jgi:hypothetical protein
MKQTELMRQTQLIQQVGLVEETFVVGLVTEAPEMRLVPVGY